MKLNFIDFAVVIIYMAVLVVMGMVLGRKNKTTDDYYLAGRSMTWFPVGLAIIGTMCSAVSFIGGPGWSYTDGLQAFMNNSNIPLVIFLATTLFVPFLYNCKVTSCYEYLEKRFDGPTRTVAACGFLFVGIAFLSSMIYTPALILNSLTGIKMEIIIPVMTGITIIYTLKGGIKAVIWTDVVQMIVLWGGLAVIVWICLSKLNMGFFEAMAIAKAEGKLKALDFRLDFWVSNGVWATLLGVGINHLQYFTCDQAQVQKLFTTKSMRDLKQSFWLGGLILNTQFFVFMFVGLTVFVFYAGKPFPSSNEVMVEFIAENVPTGILGIIIAAVFAATMSSISAIFNAMATVFVKDVYLRWFVKDDGKSQELAAVKDVQELRLAKFMTLVFGVIIGLFCYFLINGTGKSLFVIMGEYASYVNGSILGVFMLGMFSKRCTGRGAFIGYIVGVVVVYFVAKTGVNWGWYNTAGLLACLISGYVGSFLFKTPNKEGFEEYTFQGQKARLIAEGRIMEDGVYILPGKVEKFAWVLVAYFLMQYVVLYAIGGTY